jgi:Bacterial PH domain
VDEKFATYPPHRFGLIFHIVLIGLSIALGTWSLMRASDAEIGPLFLIYLAPACLALVGVPVLGYRAYALWRAIYRVERGGIRLRWGLREEDIPMDAIQWVRSRTEVDFPIPLPLIRWPGAVFGTRRLPDGRQLEYLAASARTLLLIATPDRIFAISPSDPDEFLRAFQRMEELALLASIPARSAYPSFLVSRVWAARPARILLLSGLFLAAVLLVVVTLAIPSREVVSLGFTPDGSPVEGVPAVQLLLLPVLNSFFYLAETVLGFFFFRREAEHALAYLLWGCGVLSGVLFLVASFFILRAG